MSDPETVLDTIGPGECRERLRAWVRIWTNPARDFPLDRGQALEATVLGMLRVVGVPTPEERATVESMLHAWRILEAGHDVAVLDAGRNSRDRAEVGPEVREEIRGIYHSLDNPRDKVEQLVDVMLGVDANAHGRGYALGLRDGTGEALTSGPGINTENVKSDDRPLVDDDYPAAGRVPLDTPDLSVGYPSWGQVSEYVARHPSPIGVLRALSGWLEVAVERMAGELEAQLPAEDEVLEAAPYADAARARLAEASLVGLARELPSALREEILERIARSGALS